MQPSTSSPPSDLIWRKCHCCDTPLLASQRVLAERIVPATFCTRCFENYDLLTLRKWFVLDMLFGQVQALDQLLRTPPPLPSGRA